MTLLDYNFTKSSFRAFTRFLTFFVFIYVVSVLILASFGVFDRVEAESEVKEPELTDEEAANGEAPVEMNDAEGELSEDSTVGNEDNVLVDSVLEEDVSGEDSMALNPRIPHTISIPKIGLDGVIVNPRSRDIEALNRALLDGVVYYPGSGYLGEDSNIFLFGHSSGLPVVINQNFKIFNGIKELKLADEIYLEAGGYRYTYRVTESYEAKDHQIIVDFLSSVPKLTLTTCNVFGAKEDRFIVEAVLAEKVKVR